MEFDWLSLIILLGSIFNTVCYESRLCLQPIKSSNYSSTCESKSDTLLNCSQDELIMIKEVTFERSGTGSSECAVCLNGNPSPESVQVNSTMFFNIMYEECALRQSCFFNKSVFTPINLKDRLWYAIVTYDCIQTDLFKSMCSSWETYGESDLHIRIYNDNVTYPDLCSCFIYGDERSVNVTIISYRPYINPFECSGSLLNVNGHVYSCTTSTSEDFSVYNTPVNIIQNITNLTLHFYLNLPQMLWFHVKGTHGVRAVCNGGDAHTVHTSISTTIYSSTYITKTTSSKSHTSVENITVIYKTSPSPSESTNGHVTESVITGVAVGMTVLLLIVIIVTFLYIRRRKIKEAESEGHAHYGMGLTNTRTTRVKNGIMNNSYEPADETVFSTHNIPKEQDLDMNNVYSEPVDAEVGNTYAEANIVFNLGNEDTDDGYQEMYVHYTKKNDIDSKYGEPRQSKTSFNVYNTLAEDNDYSHITNCNRDQRRQCDENYSHLNN